MKHPRHAILQEEIGLDHCIENEYATLYFYGSFVVTEVNEGVSLSLKTGIHLLIKSISYLGSRPIVLISNRINSYAVKPVDYKYLNSLPILKGIGIVYHSEEGKRNAELESNFCSKPLRTFSSIDDAYEWTKTLL